MAEAQPSSYEYESYQALSGSHEQCGRLVVANNLLKLARLVAEEVYNLLKPKMHTCPEHELYLRAAMTRAKAAVIASNGYAAGDTTFVQSLVEQIHRFVSSVDCMSTPSFESNSTSDKRLNAPCISNDDFFFRLTHLDPSMHTAKVRGVVECLEDIKNPLKPVSADERFSLNKAFKCAENHIE